MGDHRPDWLRNRSIATGEAAIGGQTIPYTVWRQQEVPELEGFVAHFQDTEGRHFYWISEAVPEGYRKYFIYHEWLESEGNLPAGDGICLAALKRELEEVSAEERKEYLTYRYAFFQRMVKADPKLVAPEIQLRLSYSYLHLGELIVPSLA